MDHALRGLSTVNAAPVWKGGRHQVCGTGAHADPGKVAMAMSLRRYAARLSAASLSPFGEFLLRFLRTMILARLLSPADLGSGCRTHVDIGWL